MRRIVLLLLIFLPMVSYAQGKYSVYRCVEDVKVYNNGSRTWLPVEKGDVLEGYDLVEVPVKQGLHVLESGSNRIYANVKAGEYTVSAIIEKSEKDANSTFKNMNRQIVKNVAKSGQGKGYSTYGMTTRGLSDDLTYADSLYYSIYKTIRENTAEEDLSIKKIVNDDATISFVVENNSDSILYVSVVYGNSSHLSLCLEDGLVECSSIPLQSNEILDLTSIKFIEPLTGDDYYVIASEREFDLSPLKTRLSYMREPDFTAAEDLIIMSTAK